MQLIWAPPFAGIHQTIALHPNSGCYVNFEPRKTQICLSVRRLIHDDDCIKVLVGDEYVQLSGIIEIPAGCVVRIVRLEEVNKEWNRLIPVAV